MSDQYPNNEEVRAWAMSKRPDLVNGTGQLPRFVIIAWDRAHPDRPYVRSQAYHGTPTGYMSRDCRCERCCERGRAYQRGLYRENSADRAEVLADELSP